MAQTGMNFLISSQNDDGGWGYFPNQTSSVEPTCCAILVLRDQQDWLESYNSAVKWLVNTQNNDGGWGINQWDKESGWQTSWAIIALKTYQANSEFLTNASNWLLDFGKESLEKNETNDTIRNQFNIDTNLFGWPWQSGEASWIEPTALALLALKSFDEDSQHHPRVEEAIKYLDDRRCMNGGWNFGNPVMFNKDLPPLTHHSSLSILALSQFSPHMILDKDIISLKDLLDEEESPLGIASGILALKALQDETSSLERRLSSMQSSDGSWEGNIYFSAMSMIALSPETIIF